MENRKFFSMMALLVGGVVILRACTGCYSEKKATNDVKKAILYFPAQTADIVNKKWPCIPLGTFHDSLKYLQQIDSVTALNDFYKDLLDHVEPIIKHDTTPSGCEDYAANELTYQNTIYIKDNLIDELNSRIKNFKPIHDVDTILDTRLIEKRDDEIKRWDVRYTIEFNARQKAQASADGKQILINWLIIVCIVLAASTGGLLYARFKIPKLIA